jgi:hypothetical protein
MTTPTEMSQDLVMATPAALLRVVLEWRIAPGMRWMFTVAEKLRILCISILVPVIVGQLARAYPKSTDWVPLPVLIIATAFLAQEIGMKALHQGRRAVRNFKSKQGHETDR